MNNHMGKSDLKNCHIVQLRNGSQGTVIDDRIHFDTYVIRLYEYNENLTMTDRNEKEYDIVKVGKNEFLSVYVKNCVKWIWERKEYELTQSEYDLLQMYRYDILDILNNYTIEED